MVRALYLRAGHPDFKTLVHRLGCSCNLSTVLPLASWDFKAVVIVVLLFNLFCVVMFGGIRELTILRRGRQKQRRKTMISLVKRA